MCLCDTCLASSFRRVTITRTGSVFLAFKVRIKLERGHILTFEASGINSIVVYDFFLGFETSQLEPEPSEPVHSDQSRSRPTFLLEAGAEIVPRSRSRSRQKMSRLRIPGGGIIFIKITKLKLQTETKPIPMKWQLQKPNTKPIFILPNNTNI